MHIHVHNPVALIDMYMCTQLYYVQKKKNLKSCVHVQIMCITVLLQYSICACKVQCICTCISNFVYIILLHVCTCTCTCTPVHVQLYVCTHCACAFKVTHCQGFPELTKSCSHLLKVSLTIADIKSLLYKK